MSWVRLDAAIFTDAKLRRVGPWGALVFFAALTYAKAHNCRGGKIPTADFDAEIVALHVNCQNPSQRKAVARGLADCLRVGLLTEDGDRICIKRWSSFQRDRTNADRQQRYRDRKSTEKDERYEIEPAAGGVTQSNEVTAYVQDRQTDSTDVQTGRTDRQTGADAPLPVGVNPAGGSAGLRPGQRLSPKAWVAVGAILDRLCEGLDGPDTQTKALVWRQLHRNGALDDETGAMLLDRFKKRFAASIAKAKKREGM